MSIDRLTAALRDIPDFPKPGVVFKDITPILSDPQLLRMAIDLFADRYRDHGVEQVVAIDSRGFLFGAALADRINAGLVPVRKKGKLPAETVSRDYELEYGTATLEMHTDAFKPGTRVLLIDDLLATGGSAAASLQLISQLGGRVLEAAFLIELTFLHGREKLGSTPVFAPIAI